MLVALAEEIRATFSDEDVAYIESASGLSLQGATVGYRIDGASSAGEGGRAKAMVNGDRNEAVKREDRKVPTVVLG